MKVISYLTGRVLQFINSDEYIPGDAAHSPEAVQLITERYSFALPPPKVVPVQEVFNKGIRFETGKFNFDGETKNIQELSLFNNGLLVTAHSTKVAEAFIDDFFGWGENTFGFQILDISKRRRVFLSELVVEFEKSFDTSLKRFKSVFEKTVELLKKTYPDANLPPNHLSSFQIEFDRQNAPAAFELLSPFTISRRANHSFEDNVCFCQAPLRTEDHKLFLESFEDLLRD